MISRLRRWFSDPLFLLCLSAGLIAFVVQSGEFGTSDTQHRLQTTHWIWTSAPHVAPGAYPEFGLRGRGGKIWSQYGIGQSLLMLPADIVGTWVSHWPIFSEYEDDPGVRTIIVSFSTSILVNVLTALFAFRLLGQLGFSVKEAVAGVLALLVCTTHLHYTQNMTENNYIGLLTLVGFAYEMEWLNTGSRRALWLGTGALGLNILTRLTAALDLMAGVFLVLAVLWLGRTSQPLAKDSRNGAAFPAPWKRFLEYSKVAIPVFAFFGLIERAYHFYRFENWTGTYLPLFAKEERLQDPTLPANFPWSTPFHQGFFGALFQPEKSIFLFDPLLILAIVLLVLLWKRLSPEVRAFGVTALVLLVGYISLYARYTYWAGDFAWGDRYVSTAVEIAAFPAVPLLIHYRASLSPWVWRAGIVLIAGSLVIQIASLMFWLPLEIYQMDEFGHPTFVIALRFKNIAAFALGKMEAWGLHTDSITYDPWDYVHLTTWNFLPFLLRRVGAASKLAVDIAFAAWGVGIAALALAMNQLRRVCDTAMKELE